MKFEESKFLRELTTFGIGGPARYFTEVQTIAALQEAIAYCSTHSLNYFVLGKGSNTLFDDRGYDGVVILNKIGFCEQNGSEFYVGAGYSFSLLGTQTARQGLAGLEFASGIPGSVGGAIYMNAGANQGETFGCLTEVTYVNAAGAVEVLSKDKLTWGYRFSSFQNQKGAIAAARFQLTAAEGARQKQIQIIGYRTKTQPYGEMSAGCVFRNASSISAGALIEQAGLKGFSIGDAAVSDIHANFIINRGDATASQVLELASHIKAVVQEKTGHTLEMEIRVVINRGGKKVTSGASEAKPDQSV